MSINPPTAAARIASVSAAQQRARKEFDLDAAMAALPPHSPTAVQSFKGSAGVRLRPHLVASISDDLLREFARETLKAARMSEQYLDALRVVLGNQAEAERMGYVLELNIRVPFAPERVMRTIIDQMRRAGLTFGERVALGAGRTQVVQCFASREYRSADAAADLEHAYRAEEDAARSAPEVADAGVPWGIPASEVPY